MEYLRKWFAGLILHRQHAPIFTSQDAGNNRKIVLAL